MKAGLATIALRKFDVFQAVDFAAEAGFQGVEIWGRAPHTPEEFDEEHTLRIRDRVRGHGMKVCMFGSYVNPSLPDYARKSEDALKIAKILGAKRIRVWAGDKEPKDADEELWPFVALSLQQYALRAEDQGIKLAIEMHGGTLCATAEGCARVLEMADAPNLKLNYQVYNSAEPDVDRTIGMLGDHVISVHAQNHRPSKLDPTKWELCLIEEGAVDYDHVLALLAQHGFKGFVEVEFLKGEAAGDAAMLDALKRDGAYLRQLTAKYTPQD